MFRSSEHTGILLLIEDDREVAEAIGDFLDTRVVHEHVKRTERTPA